jgi:hypothetical protein
MFKLIKLKQFFLCLKCEHHRWTRQESEVFLCSEFGHGRWTKQENLAVFLKREIVVVVSFWVLRLVVEV